MKVAIMQPYFFPYIGYFQLINTVDKFIIYDDVNFINKGWINRNNVLVNGNSKLITIPLKDASQNKLINEVFVLNNQKETNKILKTIELSYKKAPFFDTVYSIIQLCIHTDADSIAGYNLKILKEICMYLNISTVFVNTSTVYNNSHLKSQDRILDICLQENANIYVNPIGGINLYSREIFEDKNIHLYFIKPKSIVYPQFKNLFIPWLSIIDVLMFNSKEEVIELLNQYELI